MASIPASAVIFVNFDMLKSVEGCLDKHIILNKYIIPGNYIDWVINYLPAYLVPTGVTGDEVAMYLMRGWCRYTVNLKPEKYVKQTSLLHIYLLQYQFFDPNNL